MKNLMRLDSPYAVEKLTERYFAQILASDISKERVKEISLVLEVLHVEHKGDSWSKDSPSPIARTWTRSLEEKIKTLPEASRSQAVSQLIEVYSALQNSQLKGIFLVQLGNFNHPEVFPVLQANWNSPDKELREAARQALDSSRDRRAAAFVINAIRAEADAPPREKSWNDMNARFSKIGNLLGLAVEPDATAEDKRIGELAKKLVIRWLKSPNIQVRTNAGELLRAKIFAQNEFLSHLLPLAQDADPRARGTVTRVLNSRMYYTNDMVTLLTKIEAQDSDPAIREEAKRGLLSFQKSISSCYRLLKPREAWGTVIGEVHWQ